VTFNSLQLAICSGSSLTVLVVVAPKAAFFFVLGSNQTWDEASKNMQTCG
jgi:hypothetical protein